MLGRNQSIVKKHDFTKETVESLKKVFSAQRSQHDQLVVPLSLLDQACKPVMNCKEIFLQFREFEDLMLIFTNKEDKSPPEINFEQYLQILAVLTNGSYAHRINTFIDLHDIQNKGYFTSKEILVLNPHLWKFFKCSLMGLDKKNLKGSLKQWCKTILPGVNFISPHQYKATVSKNGIVKELVDLERVTLIKYPRTATYFTGSLPINPWWFTKSEKDFGIVENIYFRNGDDMVIVSMTVQEFQLYEQHKK